MGEMGGGVGCLPVSVDPNFANLTDMTPLDPPFEGGKFSPPPQEGELEGVNLDLLILIAETRCYE
jgi:hypothetical protein